MVHNCILSSACLWSTEFIDVEKISYLIIINFFDLFDIWSLAALAKAQQLLLDDQERDYILSQVTAAKGQSQMVW